MKCISRQMCILVIMIMDEWEHFANTTFAVAINKWSAPLENYTLFFVDYFISDGFLSDIKLKHSIFRIAKLYTRPWCPSSRRRTTFWFQFLTWHTFGEFINICYSRLLGNYVAHARWLPSSSRSRIPTTYFRADLNTERLLLYLVKTEHTGICIRHDNAIYDMAYCQWKTIHNPEVFFIQKYL